MQDRPRAAPVLVGRDGELGELLAGLPDRGHLAVTRWREVHYHRRWESGAGPV